jgi:alcohol dehydrogenase (cytochrome c)
LAAWTLLDRVILTPAAAQAPPAAAGAPPAVEPPAPPRRRPVLTPYAKSKIAAMQAPLDRLTPVTDEMLRNPPPGDWLHWRRTYDGWANSPLTQINRDTVIWKFLPNQF